MDSKTRSACGWERSALRTGAKLLLIILAMAGGRGNADEAPSSGDVPAKVGLMKIVESSRGAIAELLQPAISKEQTFRASGESLKGNEVAKVFQRVAPATVLVHFQTPVVRAHGTGFVIAPDGWIVTNHHVIGDALPNPSHGAQEVVIQFGETVDGEWALGEKEFAGTVFKSDKDKDLALVKLRRSAGDAGTLPIIPFSKTKPTPGTDCIVIGHPTAGTLWSVRNGIVTGIVSWPRDSTDNILKRLSLRGAERQSYDQMIRSAPQVKTVHSSCELNPGDSGGPLVNADGELLAVSFAGAANPATDKFGYHIHIDELIAFLNDRPRRPALYVPDPWAEGTIGQFQDLDGDQVLETLAIGSRDEQGKPRWHAWLIDLDLDSTKRFSRDELNRAIDNHAWDFELAIHLTPSRRTFWDTDDDGEIDLILIDGDGDARGQADHVRRFRNGKWAMERPTRFRLFDASVVADAAQARRCQKILARLQ